MAVPFRMTRSVSSTLVRSTLGQLRDAGPDQVVVATGSQVVLDGSASYDEDGDTLRYRWTLLQRPVGSLARLQYADTAHPSFTADVHGPYVIAITVSDPWSSSEVDTVAVSFDNLKPVADAGGNQTAIVGDTVNLNGSASSDANGDTLTFGWSLTSAPAGSASGLTDVGQAIAKLVPDLPGAYMVTLVVNDGFLNSEPATATVTAISKTSAVATVLQQAVAAVNDLNVGASKNENLKNALTNKISAALMLIEEARYAEALDKLQNDILGKTDGCAMSSAPDRNDWITDCESQAEVYPLLVSAIQLLSSMI